MPEAQNEVQTKVFEVVNPNNPASGKSALVRNTGLNVYPRVDLPGLHVRVETPPAPKSPTSADWDELEGKARERYGSGNGTAPQQQSTAPQPATSTPPAQTTPEPAADSRQQEQARQALLAQLEQVREAYLDKVYGKFRGEKASEPPSQAYNELMKPENTELREALYGQAEGLYSVLGNGRMSQEDLLKRVEALGGKVFLEKAQVRIAALDEFKKLYPGSSTATQPSTTDTPAAQSETPPSETQAAPVASMGDGQGFSKVLGAKLEISAPTSSAGSTLTINAHLPASVASESARMRVYRYEDGQQLLRSNDVIDIETTKVISSQAVEESNQLHLNKASFDAGRYMLLLEVPGQRPNTYVVAAGVAFTVSE